jgi:membrane-bound ClpP family serine protease
MVKKINFRLLGAILLSLIDEAIILIVVIIVLSQIGIDIPLWVIIITVLLFIAITFFIYRSLRKNPQLGFENMLGLSGLAIENIGRKGTVRIDGELWAAKAKDENIKVGTQILVVEQTGLKLTVVKKPENAGHF